jgi:phospholipid/cholesterol/gamma-HCH transport system substrate-binding protein
MQFIIGVFAIGVGGVLAYLAFWLGASEILPPPGYSIYADFDDIGGLKTGDQVAIAGVPIGVVTQISLKDNRARIEMRINEGVEIDNEATAAIEAVGIIGGESVSVAPDSGHHSLRDGETLRKTRSAFVLEDVIGRFITSSKGGSP